MSDDMSLHEIIHKESTILDDADQKYGPFFRNAHDFIGLMQDAIMESKPDAWLFAIFFSQVKKFTLLAFFSALRLHRVQAMQNMRQVLEAGANAAYGIANSDHNHYAKKGPHDTLETSKELVYLDADESVGSGFFIGNSEILTNAHVVEGVSTLEVVTQGGLRMQGTVQGRDEILDVALIKVNAQRVSDLNLELGDSSRAHQGDEVFAFGFPFGIEGDVSFKEGTISRTLGEGDASLFETSVEIHPGNSGGPLVDRYGSVIGINNARFGKSVSGVSLGETIKFAIPINVVQQQLADLRAGANVVKEKKAGGGMVIVNDTNFEQTLVATTRFKSEEGYIYRITETVVIPAHSLVEAPVLADKDGKQYELNCSIKTCYFTIPGFIGSSRHYDIFGLATKNLYIGNELPNVSDPVPIGKSNTNKTTTSYFPPKSSIPPESLSFDEKDRWCSQKHGLFSVYDSALNVCGCTEGRGPSKDSIWECIDIAAMCKRWFGAGAQRKAEASFFNFSMEATDLCYCFNSEWSKDFTQCII